MKTLTGLILFYWLIPVMMCAQDTNWFQKGLKEKDPVKQVECFTQSIELESDQFAAYFCRASARLGLGDIQGAIDDYTRCIEIDPDDAAVYYNRGMAKKRIAPDYQGAVADVNKTCEIISLKTGYGNLVNGMDLKAEDYPLMITRFKMFLTFCPDNTKVLANLGYCFLATGDFSAALENFNKSLALQPEKIDAILGICLAYYYKNDLVNAKKYLDCAATLKPALMQGVEGFETFKREGFICNKKDNEALKMMLSQWK
jgi:tetratricopeptide (TPR) repeat protein